MIVDGSELSVIDWLVAGYVILFCLLWCGSYLISAHQVLFAPLFEKQNPPIPLHWPSLSIVIPACNEAHMLRQTVEALLGQEYPNLEIILVNDRSTDSTCELIETMAATDARVRGVNIEHLPAQWLGKVHALHTGTQMARGEWMLYTDADVHFQPGTLYKAIAFALARQCDHLTLWPRFRTRSFWLEVVTVAFSLRFLNATKPADLDIPESTSAIGVGAFNLVRKATLDKTEGFPWLRMEVVDDVGLGLLLKRAGARSCFAFARQYLSLEWYPSITAMFKGLEKNFFGAGAHYSYLYMAWSVGFLWALVLAPLIAISYPSVPFLWLIGVAAYLVLIIVILMVTIRLKTPFLPGLFVPIGYLVLSLMMVHAGVMCKRQGGVAWRGTRYLIEELRMGQRVKF